MRSLSTVVVLLLTCMACSRVDGTPNDSVPRWTGAPEADAGVMDPPAADAGLDASVVTPPLPEPDGGTDAAVIVPPNPACPEHAARIVASNFPPAITSRFLVHASLTVENTGTSTWRRGGEVLLGSPGNDDPFVTNARVELSADVPPGAHVTFDLPLRAPEPAGTYATSWQMLEEHRCWFGETFTTVIESRTPVATGQCTNPAPTGVDEITAVVHNVGPARTTLDSTAKVCDRDYCSAIGFTDFRTCCPARAEGHPDVDVCNAAMVGTALDTGRVGPTWTFNGQRCGPSGPGNCDNHPTNQFLLFVYGPGTARACSNTNGVCGEVVVP
ncbi:MAG: NBR1-Ig-like domain-containing protein [Myxococcaceae bacterium]